MALIVGPDEVAAGTVSLRPLRGSGEQRTVPRSEVVEAVRDQPAADDRPGRLLATAPSVPRGPVIGPRTRKDQQ